MKYMALLTILTLVACSQPETEKQLDQPRKVKELRTAEPDTTSGITFNVDTVWNEEIKVDF